MTATILVLPRPAPLPPPVDMAEEPVPMPGEPDDGPCQDWEDMMEEGARTLHGVVLACAFMALAWMLLFWSLT